MVARVNNHCNAPLKEKLLKGEFHSKGHYYNKKGNYYAGKKKTDNINAYSKVQSSMQLLL